MMMDVVVAHKVERRVELGVPRHGHDLLAHVVADQHLSAPSVRSA